MIVTFYDGEDQTNHLHGTAIRDNSRLFHMLRSMRNRSPFICKLVGENGYYLDVGIGKVGFVQYSACDGNPPYLIAVSPNSEPGDNYVEFMTGGTPTPISTRYCLPFDEVLQIVGYFLETGRTCPRVAWERVWILSVACFKVRWKARQEFMQTEGALARSIEGVAPVVSGPYVSRPMTKEQAGIS
jgi:hypothetical protein